MLKIAGSVEKTRNQVVKTPRVLTPRCWKQRVLRWSFSEKCDTTMQNHCLCTLYLQAEVTVFKLYVLWFFTRVSYWNTDFCKLADSEKYVNLHANYQVPQITSMFSRGKIEIWTQKNVFWMGNLESFEICFFLVKTHAFWKAARVRHGPPRAHEIFRRNTLCLLYTSDAADE